MRIAAALFLTGLLLIITAPTAKADHNLYLPIVPNTPLMKQVKAQQEYTYCVNPRGQQYPNFVNQVRDVQDQYTELVGIRSKEVTWGDPACQVKHEMLDQHSCSGCAAWILYANWPVQIQYKAAVGYTDWRTTIGHELGHGLLGLHEQYRDSSGSIQCTGKTTTVMDCGSGVRYPTSRDITLGCAVLLTNWCGTSGYSKCQTIDYDPCTGRWYFADGWSYAPASGVWFNIEGLPEWSPCNADKLRWNYTLSAWMPPGASFFLPGRGYWAMAGAC